MGNGILAPTILGTGELAAPKTLGIVPETLPKSESLGTGVTAAELEPEPGHEGPEPKSLPVIDPGPELVPTKEPRLPNPRREPEAPISNSLDRRHRDFTFTGFDESESYPVIPLLGFNGARSSDDAVVLLLLSRSDCVSD